MSELGGFQDAFGRALAGDAAALAPWTSAKARLAVYRNTIGKGCADALAANLPTLVRVVGEAWMREAGLCFAREHPPAEPSLMRYGDGFPGWLAGFGPAADMPWLADLARIDLARRDALFAADAEPLGPAGFAALSPEAYAETGAEPHPAAAALWFETGAPSLWLALQADPPPAHAALAPEAQGLLVARAGGEVEARLLTRGGFAFLEVCRLGESLAAAGAAALSAEPDLPLAEAFAEFIAAGAFSRIRPRAGPVS